MFIIFLLAQENETEEDTLASPYHFPSKLGNKNFTLNREYSEKR